MPCNMKLYPPDWKERRKRILIRAKDCCEQCGVKNKVIGHRDDNGVFHPKQGLAIEGAYFTDADGVRRKLIRIVLTIAHLHEGELDVPDDQLRAWCQRCHNLHDAAMRARHRKEKRFNRAAVGSLMEV